MNGIRQHASSPKSALRASTAIGLLAASHVWIGTAQAQEAESLPAVSSLNAKIAIAGGVAHHDDIDPNGFASSAAPFSVFDSAETDGLALLLASLTIPVDHAFGAQIDVAGGAQGDGFIGGIGGHLFWRDPGTGLLGVTGAYGVNTQDSFATSGYIYSSALLCGSPCWADFELARQEILRVAAEGELYQGQFTFHGVGGYQWGENIHEGAFARGGIRYYVTDNFMVGFGAGASDEIGGFGTAEMEFLATGKVSVFADMRTEFDTYFHGVAGLRIYFGPSDTLIAKHRQDDPTGNAAHDAIAAIQSTQKVVDVICCFTAETAILMADGTTKAIGDVAIGDLVLGEGGCVNRVMEIETPCLGERKLYAFNDGAPFVTAEHPFMTRDGWKSIDPEATFAETGHFRVASLAAGDELVVLANVSARAVPMAAGDPAAMTEMVVETAHLALARIDADEDDPARTVYNLRLNGNNTYFANAFLVHNK